MSERKSQELTPRGFAPDVPRRRGVLTSIKVSALTLVVLLVACVTTLADTNIYDFVNGAWEKVGEISGGANEAVACVGGSCYKVDCSQCHTSAVSRKNYTTLVQRKHFDDYYRKIEVRLSEGQKIAFGQHKILRERNRLVFIDRSGGRHPLPAGAMLLKNKSGDNYITYPSASRPW